MNCFSSLLVKALRVLSIFFLLGSCTIEIDRQLDRIEQDLSFQPDSAYAKLLGISAEELRPESRRARYALLMSLAMDKTYRDVADDSLAQIAVRYYNNHGDTHHRMLALYSLGRVQRNAGNNTGAIISFLETRKIAHALSDFHYLGLSSRNVAVIYGDCYDEDSELRYYKESSEAFFSYGEEYYASFSQIGEARVYMAKGLTESADSLLRIIEDYARSKDSYLLGLVLMDRALNLMKASKSNAQRVIELYSEADSLKSSAKTTADYGTLAFAYEVLNVPDSVDHYIRKTTESVKTLLDSVHFYNSFAKLYNYRKDYKAANEQLMKGLKLQNQLVFKRENQQIANAITSYSQQESIRQSEVAHYRLVLFLLSITASLVLLIVLVLVVINRRLQIREKNRIIQEQELKIEEDLASIQDFSDQIQNSQLNQSEMAKTISVLMGEKIAIVKQCADAYEAVKNGPKVSSRDPYRYLDEDPVKIKTEEMHQFLNAFDAFRRDDSLFLLLEESVNKWRGNIMQRLRCACDKETMQRPRFSEDDFRIIMLLYAGIPDRSIAFLMDMTCAAIRTRKSRYKERLVQEDIPEGAFFVQEMTEKQDL